MEILYCISDKEGSIENMLIKIRKVLARTKRRYCGIVEKINMSSVVRWTAMTTIVLSVIAIIRKVVKIICWKRK